MSAGALNIPIVQIDIAGFSRWKTVPEQRAVLARLDGVLAGVLKHFTGLMDPREVFEWQSLGDGYYIILAGCSSPMAMRFAVDLESALREDNAAHTDYELRLRVGFGTFKPLHSDREMSPSAGGNHLLREDVLQGSGIQHPVGPGFQGRKIGSDHVARRPIGQRAEAAGQQA